MCVCVCVCVCINNNVIFNTYVVLYEYCTIVELYIFLRNITENRVGPKVYVEVYCNYYNSKDAAMIYD